jgi:uncharacterized ferredoxin-like protein
VTSKTVAHLREVAERLRIRGEYDSRGSDVADATACTIGADELERLRAALEKIAERVAAALTKHDAECPKRRGAQSEEVRR